MPTKQGLAERIANVLKDQTTHAQMAGVGIDIGLVILEGTEGASIQITDVVLWLYSQFRKERELPIKCRAIVKYVLAHGWESDFSFSGVDRVMQERYGAIFSTPITPEQEAQARALLAKAEENRLAAMAQFERDGLPPFMRDASAAEALMAQEVKAK